MVINNLIVSKNGRKPRKITSEPRRAMMRELKQSGMSYAEIAKKFSISRQRVQQLVTFPERELEVLLDSANGICEVCGEKAEKIELHHENYLSNEVMAVCTVCHRHLHKGEYRPVIYKPTGKMPEIQKLKGSRMDKKHTTMAIPLDTLARLRSRADKSRRSPQSEIEHLLDIVEALEFTGHLSYLTAPAGNPVPVLNVKNKLVLMP